MRDYELTVIVRPQLDEETFNGLVEKIKGWISAGDGQVVRVDHWGRRRMAYTVKKEREGVYVYFLSQMNPAQVASVERNLRITEEILRHLFVQIEPEAKAETPAEPEPVAAAAAA